jgi:catechol 2,3-dioxygenase
MASSILDPKTRLGAVHLNVLDLNALTRFYEETLGLKGQQSSPDKVILGAGGEALLVLHGLGSSRKGEAARQHSAGLYHFCLAVEHREALGWWLKKLLDLQTPLQGLVDHRMAEAVYLADPEGNGIELNWDKPRDEWPTPEKLIWEGNLPLDVEGLLAAGGRYPGKGLPSDTRVGHIHLHIADLKECERFYTELLGFEKVMRIPGQAVFVSAGGYHHHVAFNVWQGKGIPPSPEGRPGLRRFTVCLQGEEEGRNLVKRLEAGRWPFEKAVDGILVKDPSGNALLMTRDPRLV